MLPKHTRGGRSRRTTWSLLATALFVIAACRGRDTPLAPPSTLVVPGGGLPGFPGTVTDLAVVEVAENSATLSFSEVDDGLGQPARYVVRFGEPPIEWGSAQDVTEGTCATPVLGQGVGAQLSCTVAGLKPATTYEFQVAAYRSTLDLVETFGDPSNVAQGTTTCDCWTTRAPMAAARVNFAVAVVNGALYAIGGDGSDHPLFNTVEAYDPATDTWTMRARLPSPRTGVKAAVIDGVIYVVGGTSSEATLDAYDPANDTWTTKTPMPTPRYAPGVAAVNGVLYVIGGESAPDHVGVATVEAYDPATDTWTAKASMPTARSRLGVAEIDGVLYAVGGYRTTGSAAVEAYDPASDTWTTKTPMSRPRYGLGVAAMNGKLYAVGGWTNGADATNEAYDPANDTWTTKTQMPTARQGLGVEVLEGLLYAVGGSDYFRPHPTVEVYRP